MAEGKPGSQIGELLDQMLTVAQEDPDEFVRSVKAGASSFAENTVEFQRKVRNRGISILATLAKRRLFPDDGDPGGAGGAGGGGPGTGGEPGAGT